MEGKAVSTSRKYLDMGDTIMCNELIGLIPAAGGGTRISPLPSGKKLFPIGFQKLQIGKDYQSSPKVISQYLIDNMLQAGARKDFHHFGKRKADIMHYFSRYKEYGNHFSPYLIDDEVRGMPCTMDVAWPSIKENTVLFGMPDTILAPTNAMSSLVSQHRANKAGSDFRFSPPTNPKSYAR